MCFVEGGIGGVWKLREGVIVFMINAVRKRQRGQHIKLALAAGCRYK